MTALIDGLNNLAGASVTPIVTITETNSVRLTLSTSADQSAVIAAVDSQVCVGTATCTVTEASSGRRRALQTSSTVTLEVMRTIVYDPATASTTMIVVGDEVATAAQIVDATAALVDVSVSLDASVALQVDESTAVSSVDELLTSEAVQAAVDAELALGLPCTTASIDAIITPPAPPPYPPPFPPCADVPLNEGSSEYHRDGCWSKLPRPFERSHRTHQKRSKSWGRVVSDDPVVTRYASGNEYLAVIIPKVDAMGDAISHTSTRADFLLGLFCLLFVVTLIIRAAGYLVSWHATQSQLACSDDLDVSPPLPASCSPRTVSGTQPHCCTMCARRRHAYTPFKEYSHAHTHTLHAQ